MKKKVEEHFILIHRRTIVVTYKTVKNISLIYVI